MAKSKPNPKVGWYFTKNKQWLKEIETLRDIALNSGLSEELKWGCPAYTLDGKNVVLIHVFKEYCAYLFFKGALLKDTKKILVQQTENVQAGRQIRFTNEKEIVKLKATLKAYIKEAIDVEKKGLKIDFKKTKEFQMPEEFESALSKSAALKKAFYGLTPGRQRGYLLFFGSAKQAATRESRIAKCTKQILSGKGIDD
jgi:uncharacterized protein YdeI (YjbR/CyaY-like superfamily)